MRTDLAVWVVLLIIVTAVRWSTTSALVPLISQQQQVRPRPRQVQLPIQRQQQSTANYETITALPTTSSQRRMLRLQSSVDVPGDHDGSTTSSSASVRYRCRVAYDGSGFSGFQLQRQGGRGDYGGGGDEDDGTTSISKRTVQGVMEQVLNQRFGRGIRVVGAGRTDTGVHARGQAVHFDLTTTEHDKNSNHHEQPLETAMNKMLPSDIRVWNVGMAPAPCEEHVKNHGTKKLYAWNVMRKSSSKLYSYRICLADAMDPLRRHDRWQIDSNWFQSGNTKMDPEHLAQLLRRYEGNHDFVCFAGALEANARKTGVKMTTVRTVHRCELICEDEHYKLYRIDIYLDGALYKMVRNLVGTAIDVWRQAFPQESFGRLLDEPSKHGLTRDDNPCKPAPPHGLTLERVFYAGDEDF